MKTRIVLGLSLLILLLALGVGSAVWIQHATGPVTEDLERAALLVEQGQPEQGKVLALRAKKTWESHWKAMAALLDHRSMDEVDAQFARVEWYAETGDADQMGAFCRSLSRLVEAAADDHRLTWWDLL